MLAHGIARGAGIGKPRRNNAPYPIVRAMQHLLGALL